MIAHTGLQLRHVESSIEEEPIYYVEHQQSLAKVISAGRYQHGLSRNNLITIPMARGR